MRWIQARFLLLEALSQRTPDLLTTVVRSSETHCQVVEGILAAFQSPVPVIGTCQVVALALATFIARHIMGLSRMA